MAHHIVAYVVFNDDYLTVFDSFVSLGSSYVDVVDSGGNHFVDAYIVLTFEIGEDAQVANSYIATYSGFSKPFGTCV